MKRVAVFPGQGAQAVGMGKALHDAFPVARAVFEEVDEALGERLSAIAFEGPTEALTLTANAQPALFATSLAAVRAFEAASGRMSARLFAYVAGHSLGEYSALAAAGAITVADGARLLRLRGRAMQEAVAPGVGAMAAILGLDVPAVEALAAAAAQGETCELANDNGDGQAVISGHREAVMRAVALAKERGAKRSVLLQVSAPFHCALMAPAAERLSKALAEVEIVPPAMPLVANVTAQPVAEPARLRELLGTQVTARVRWRESMRTLDGLGVGGVVELGAGRVLAGLARRAMPAAEVASLQAPADVETLARALEGGG